MAEKSNYNPYEDGTLHETQLARTREDVNDRSGFNDVMRHYDIVNGHQVPKRLEHLPKRIRRAVRLLIAAGVGGFLFMMVWSLLESVFG